MKKALSMLLSFALVLCLLGCNNEESEAGGGESKITGSIAYFYGDKEAAIKVFSSKDTQTKEIELSKETTYTIGLRPSFVGGSKSAVYIGDCAEFTYIEGSCEIKYISDRESSPIYEFIIKTDNDFVLTISVDGYVQTIKILVR